MAAHSPHEAMAPTNPAVPSIRVAPVTLVPALKAATGRWKRIGGWPPENREAIAITATALVLVEAVQDIIPARITQERRTKARAILRAHRMAPIATDTQAATAHQVAVGRCPPIIPSHALPVGNLRRTTRQLNLLATSVAQDIPAVTATPAAADTRTLALTASSAAGRINAPE
jgi:hypothetical protein